MPPLPCKILRIISVVSILVGLPLIGIVIAGVRLGPYLQFPPLTRYVAHAPFNAAAFGFICLLDVGMIAGVLLLFKRSAVLHENPRQKQNRAFPVWGWMGMVIMIAGWVLAWTRFAWFAPLQEHTFCIPWVGYILCVNALCVQRSGRSLMTDAPVRFWILFPASALFWWYFEYLNRFVQNWYYVGVENYGPLGYILLASLAFATVLPAVLSTYRLMLTFPVFNSRLSAVCPIRLPDGRLPAALCFLATAGGLAFIGIFPDYLYPLVWFAPLLVITSLQALGNRPTLFSAIRHGDWRKIISSAVAALICGFFWEMWNFYSLSRWEYAVPYVDRFHIFAMPLLGYGGYPPFGLECLVIGQAIIGKYLKPVQHGAVPRV